jgi:predicted MPP superfamily phosphohydrolase
VTVFANSPPCFTWLHLTDLHVGMTNQDWLWPTLKNAIFDDLEKVHALAGPWDLVIFSGDLVQSGLKSEYEKLDAILSDLWGRFAKLGFSPELITLPGNHDLQRPALNSTFRTLKRWWDEVEVQKELFAQKDNEYILAIEKMFEQYSKWTAGVQTAKFGLRKEKTGILPGDQSFLIEKEGLKIGLVALNSTWLQIDGGEYKGQLHVDTKQLLAVTDDDPDHWCSKNDLNLLITHHPSNWLHDQSREFWLSEINTSRFAAHIFGHVHEASTMINSVAGAAPRVELQGISAFGLTKIRDKLDRAHGYSAVRFNPAGSGCLQIWPRKTHPAAGGGYNVSPDVAFTLDLKQSFTIPLSLKDKSSSAQTESDSLSQIPHVGSSIQASLRELEATFPASPAHTHVRNVEQKLTIDALHSQRVCWIAAEWGLGEDGFISTIKTKISSASPVYKVDLSEFQNRGQFSELLKRNLGFNFERFCQLLSESGGSILLLDNVMATQSLPDAFSDEELEKLVNVVLEYCPTLKVILRSHRRPGTSAFTTVQISTLDAADLRSYVSDHPAGTTVPKTQSAIDQLHRYTEGIPSRIDQALRELQVVSLSDLVSSDVDFAVPNPASLRSLDSLVIAIRSLSESSDTATRKEFALLKALSLFPQGESLGRIERFHSTSKFYPSTAADLLSKGFIEVVSHQGLRIGASDEPEKKLKIGLTVRECVWDLLDKDEPYELNRRAAELYFGPNWNAGAFKPPRSYRFDSPLCPPGDIINANTILVRLLKEAIKLGKRNNIDRVLGLSRIYIGALERGDHYSSAAGLCSDLLPLIPSQGFADKTAQLSTKFASALRMNGKHEEAKEIIGGILDHDFSTSEKQGVLMDLAYCHDSLSEEPDARAVAKQVIELDPHSESALAAEALIIELATDDPRRLEKLKAIEIRARKEDADVTAGNVALIRADEARGNLEEVRAILAPLINSKKSDDFYNRTRAVVKLAETSLKSGESLTDPERLQLVRAYHFIFNEQMQSLFDRCHDALWCDFSNRKELQNLLILFRHSSLRWRLRGQDAKEKKYLRVLKNINSKLLSMTTSSIEKEIAYYQGRDNFYSKLVVLKA